MSITLFSSLANGAHLAFDVTADILRFDAASISAAEVRIAQVGADLSLAAAGKTVWLDGVSTGLLAIENIEFADGSYLVFGDGTSSTFHDAYGQYYTLETSSDSNQIWGLGGADLAATGAGADWLVGNVALAPLNHVSRNGSTGSPVSSTNASISADGRFVAFEGDWTGFGTDGGEGILVKDMVDGSFTNEHRNASGVEGGSGAGAPIISADGNVVAFLSASSNLVDGPASGALYDIYVSDPHGSEIVRASTGTGDTLAADGRSLNPDLSGTGRYVVFESSVSNFAAGGSTSQYDIFLKDLAEGGLVRVSTSTTGGDGNGDSRYAKVSADGDFVVFQSEANNLTSGDTNGYTDVFLWSDATDTLVNISRGIAAVSNPNNGSFNPDVAYNGDGNAIVVFETGRNLVAADTSNGTDVYAYNFVTEELQLVSSKADGSGVALSSGNASISDDGRWVAFTSYSDALVPGDSNGSRDIFVKDLYTGRIALVSKSAAGVAANAASDHAQISSGGDWIVFESGAGTLASTDANGGFSDVFRVANPLLVDTLQGGAGDDTYVLARKDTIVEASGGGLDTVQASLSYTLAANVENLVLTGTAGLTGTGNVLANTITGNAGNNRIDGAGGSDTASYANAGNAVIVSLALTTAQNTGFGSDTLVNTENLAGSRFNDRLTGNAGANRLDGGAGADTLTGGQGSDTYVVDANTDIISEAGTVAGNRDAVISSVTWTIGATLEDLTLAGSAANGTGNAGANRITGNTVANALTGQGGDDTIGGGGGSDTLSGGSGNDLLTGGTGADRFAFTVRTGSDTIADFLTGTDKLAFSQATVRIGDGDLAVEGATKLAGPGGFAAGAELVIVTANAAALTGAGAAAAIGAATGAYTVGRTALFVVDTGTKSGVFLFQAVDANATVSAAELTLLATLNGAPTTATADFVFIA